MYQFQLGISSWSMLVPLAFPCAKSSMTLC